MTSTPAPSVRRVDRLREAIDPFLRFFTGPYADLEGDPETANFAVGNPHDVAMPSYVQALRNHLEPQEQGLVRLQDERARSAANGRPNRCRNLTGLDWDPDDINMTNGGFAAIAVALQTLLEPGDEAIFLSPPWFFYEQLILAAQGTPRTRQVRHAGLRPGRRAYRSSHHAAGPG